MTDCNPRSLPPLVDGNIYGHLTVTVDEILWRRQYSGEVFVLLQWWGDCETVSLRPADISKYPESTKESNSVTYNIQTDFSLFKAYLKRCCKLKLLIVNCDSKEVVGHSEINNLLKHITDIQYQKYFSIVTSSGTRIGELRVDFELYMNSIPEETLSKKMRKRSRRKNKSAHSSFRSVDEEEKSKQIKRACKTCSDHKPTFTDSKLNLELPESPLNGKVPSSTEQTDSSGFMLLDVFQKGKKLRDAMVLSVLEDCDAELDETLLLKFDQNEKEDKTCYKTIKSQINGDIVTLTEEKLINDYLDGKTMKEEEEILVLNTLHSEDREVNSQSKTSDDPPRKLAPDTCCLSSKTSCPHSASGKSQSGSNNSSGVNTQASHMVSEGEKNSLHKKINCFRLTIDSLTLSTAGWKKINQAVDNKSKNCDSVPPPGATYFVECHFVEDSPRSQAQSWKSTPLRFCSRRQIENVVYFGQSSAHSLRPPHSLTNTESELATTSCLVCWRHLNQRVPALLGRFSLGGLLGPSCLETTTSLPVTTDTDTVVAHVRLRLELGRDKLYFGQALHNDTQSDLQDQKNSIKISEEERIVRIKEVPLNFKDLHGRSELLQMDTKRHITYTVDTTPATLTHEMNQNTLYNHKPIPVCSNCGQNLVLATSIVQNLPDSSLCVSCTNLLSQHQVQFMDPKFKISIPKDFDTKEQRHHEFLIGIDTVIGFPLFAGIKEELSCYVDYKFPEITSRLKAEMAQRETTSRVVGCEAQVLFSSVHRHALALPVALPLSPLLAGCSPGVTLRLWLRYYKPGPRDHMVAMALLPMDELCLMELEFDQKQQKSAVMKVLELPLALVPSSVTAPYQQYHNLGVLRVSVTYCNHISDTDTTPSQEYQPLKSEVKSEISQTDNFNKQKTEMDFIETTSNDIKKCGNARNIHTLPNNSYSAPISKPETSSEVKKDSTPIDALLDKISVPNENITEEDLKTFKNRFWTGPFGKKDCEKMKYEIPCPQKNDYTKPSILQSKDVDSQSNIALDPLNKLFVENHVQNDRLTQECSRPVMKEDFDILAESLEQRFNQLQSDLMKERQRGLRDVDNIVMDTSKLNSFMNDNVNDDFLPFHSLSSNSSMESLPFILGPPADFKDIQNTVVFSKANKPFSDSASDKSSSDTISGFLREEKIVENLGSNESFDGKEQKHETAKPKTFKAKIKIDRAVNLKAVKTPSNGKKGKIPPSTWISFGTGDCCEQNCGSGGLVCSGRRFTTPVVRRNYNPIWNLAWDIDLPIEYLLQVNKRLVFRVFEENLDVGFGFASANLSILTSGLPCLSSWLSINDLAGACKGQIKIVVTPLEDVSQYQECSVFDTEEDEFEEVKEITPDESSPSESREPAAFVASQTEVFVNEAESSNSVDKEVEQLTNGIENKENEIDGEDPFSVDDVISDYRNTLENNFRNEMAGLENLIKFLRVGSMSNELSFLRATENKENMSSNPSSMHPNTEVRTVTPPETGGKFSANRSVPVSCQNGQRDRILIDASTETVSKDETPSSSHQEGSEDILSKLLQQISMFQLPTIKIADNTSQTVMPETKETCTETNVFNQSNLEVNRTVHMKDVGTEANEIVHNFSPQLNNNDRISQSPHVCGELGSVLLQHFLTCKPAAVKVTDSSCQTLTYDKTSTVDSSGVFSRSQQSGMSTEILRDNFPSGRVLPEFSSDWISSEEAQSNSERLVAIDNNIKDLERFLKENLILAERDGIMPVDSNEGSTCGSLNIALSPSVKESRSPSDAGSIENYSQLGVVPPETPDGGNPSILDKQDPSNTDDTGTTLKRQGTFVIDKSKDSSEKTEKENEEDQLA